MRYLLELECSPIPGEENEQQNLIEGESVIFYAILKSKKRATRMLLEPKYKLDIFVKSSDGVTTLFGLALKLVDFDLLARIYELLIERGISNEYFH